jgi:flagellar biosynthesis repressor protein FlbT
MALRLTLKPRERAIIGGAVIRNGDARPRLVVENSVPVLREPDILSPRAVRTPCQRIRLALQLMYVDTDRVSRHLDTYRSLADEVAAAAPSCRRWLRPIEEHVQEGRYYQAIKSARALIDHERELMSNV